MRSRFFVAAGLALGLAGCDQATKRLAELSLPTGRVTLIPGVFDLAYVENRDVGFHLLRAIESDDLRWMVIVAISIAALGILAVGLAWSRDRTPLTATAIGLVSAGALGNLVDRVARGHVVDFLYVHHWPVFNVADIAIAIGAALLVWTSLRTRDRDA